jgi:pyruvate,orthophosphate dikinase
VASIGVATGAIALDSEAAERMHQAGTPAILVCRDALTADIKGINSSEGILTARGARTSHAAVVARQLGKACLVACPGLEIDLDHRSCKIGGQSLNEGDLLSIDGNDGAVYVGSLEMLRERPERELERIASWQTVECVTA